MKTATTTKKPSIRATAAKAQATSAASKATRRAVTTKPKSAMSYAVGGAVRFFVMIEGARPSAGQRLAAHTDAALRFLGLHKQEPAGKAAVLSIFGTRALQYHERIGNLEEKGGMVHLTKKGYNFFRGRAEEGKVDADLSNAFLAAITEGAVSSTHGIKASHLAPVEMPLR